jgi:diphthine-ammonia ligase
MDAEKGFKFIALISGGKDSLFSILHCMKNGHECVALANLYPPNVHLDEHGNQIENDEDTDSYMYQTVGHSVIPLYEEALGLPLFRRPISGTAVDQSLVYKPDGTTSQPGSTIHSDSGIMDEAEDMYLLLKDVLAKHPDAKAVSTGAILSTYQRARVESVVIRLGLVPLSYLWQYPYLPPYRDEALLEDMNAVKQYAKIIKVASGGLNNLFLGLNVADPFIIERLRNKMSKFNPEVGAILGEGGEFETLAMKGPKPLWKKKIIATQQKGISTGSGSYALHLKDLKTEDYGEDEDRGTIDSLRVPPILPLCPGLEPSGILDYIFTVSLPHKTRAFRQYEPTNVYLDIGMRKVEGIQFSTTEHGHCIRLSNIMGTGPDAKTQMESIVQFLRSWLLFLYDLKPSSIVSTTLLLRTMTDFQGVNTAYNTLFTEALPPARVTMAIGDFLPEGKYLSLSLTVRSGRIKERTGLHVQSRSYWAPANIGPYSQAIVETLENLPFVQSSTWLKSEIVHLAGQIALVPASMEMLQQERIPELKKTWSILCPKSPDTFSNYVALQRAQIFLALQNLLKVTEAMKVNPSDLTAMIAFFSHHSTDMARAACYVWELSLKDFAKTGGPFRKEVEPEAITGDSARPRNAARVQPQVPYLQTLKKMIEVAENDYEFETEVTRPFPIPKIPCFCIFVAELPRSSLVEWWSIALRWCKQASQEKPNGALNYFCYSPTTGVVVAWITMRSAELIADALCDLSFDIDEDRVVLDVDCDTKRPLITLFAAAQVDSTWMGKWQPTLVPCERIIHNETDLDALMMITCYPADTAVQ